MKNFWTDAYRPFFASALLTLVAALVVWLIAFVLPTAITWQIAPNVAHTHWMLWGVLNGMVFGFGLTAFPRQNSAEPPTARRLQLWAGMFFVAQVMRLVGALVDQQMFIFGAALSIGAQALIIRWMTRIVLRQDRAARTQPGAMTLAIALNATAELTSALAVAGSLELNWHNAAMTVGLVATMPLLIASVAWRVVPFFIEKAGVSPKPIQKSNRLLPLMLLLVALRVGATALTQVHSLGDLLAGIVDVVMGAALAAEFLRWWPGRLTRAMIDYIFLGMFWFAVALMALGTAEIVAYAQGHGSFVPYRKEILHMLVVGGYMTLVLAIATRVSLGHAGKPIKANLALHVAVWTTQLAFVWRTFGPIIDPTGETVGYQGIYAALPMLVGWLFWGAKMVPLFFYKEDAPGNVNVAVKLNQIKPNLPPSSSE